jgi:hypothetical protein
MLISVGRWQIFHQRIRRQKKEVGRKKSKIEIFPHSTATYALIPGT